MSTGDDALRRSTLATLCEICEGEAKLKAAGVDIADEDEWMQLRDIVLRIERKLAACMSSKETVE